MPRYDLADEYFNRAYETVVGTERETMPVLYGLFCRKPGVMAGVKDVADFLNGQCAGPITVRALPDGKSFEANQIVMTLEGPFGQLVTMETTCLGLLSLSAGAANMAAVTKAAGDIPVIDMAARHYPPELVEAIALAAAIGGAAGTSTPAGHSVVQERFGIGDGRIQVGQQSPRSFNLYGTIPHALNAIYEGSSIESAAAFHERCPDVPLTVLLDFEGREKEVCSDAARRFSYELHAVRLDTPANRVFEGGHDRVPRALEMRVLSQAPDRAAALAALDKYGAGPGVTIEAVYAIRDLLDSMGSRSTKIVVSSGFDLGKVRAFRAACAPMDSIGTGSWVGFSAFTADILKVFENDQWGDRCKAGRRAELIDLPDLPVILAKEYQAPSPSPDPSQPGS
ncbi:MAG TPA: hypothetical protein VLM89_09575 [Phycisphaerae bacterium]|nr:hypothetical protein [Phycisphaerae bacterium]